MKNLIKFIAAGLLVTGVVSAKISDFTIFRTVDPHKSKLVSVEVAAGNAAIDVDPLSKGLISCELVNSDGEVSNQEKTNRCVFNFQSKIVSNLKLKVTNESDSPMDFRALVHEAK